MVTESLRHLSTTSGTLIRDLEVSTLAKCFRVTFFVVRLFSPLHFSLGPSGLAMGSTTVFLRFSSLPAPHADRTLRGAVASYFSDLGIVPDGCVTYRGVLSMNLSRRRVVGRATGSLQCVSPIGVLG